MKIKERLKNIYLKIVKADDTPHRIALGFAIGIFYGLIPLVGVIFTIVTAFLFRANKISALVGCFVTNTWMTALLILPSVKVGSKIFGLDWQVVWQDLARYMKISNFKDMFGALSGDVIIPSLVGFFVIALCISAVGYFVSLYLILKYRSKKTRRKQSRRAKR